MLGEKAVNIKLHAMPGGEGGGGLKTISCGSRKVFHMGVEGVQGYFIFSFLRQPHYIPTHLRNFKNSIYFFSFMIEK